LLPAGWGLSLPANFWAFVLFLVSMVIALFTVVAISMFTVDLIFKTQSQKGVVVMITTLCAILNGSFIPMPLLPQSVQNVLNYLPFRFTADLPFRIYMGNVSLTDGLIAIGMSIVWLVILVVVGKLLIKKSLKKVVIQGG